jgi:hypothetical protein
VSQAPARIPHFVQLVAKVTPERVADVDGLRKILNDAGLDADPVHIELAYQSWSVEATKKAWHPLGYRKDADHLKVLTESLERAVRLTAFVPPPVEPHKQEEPADDVLAAKQDDDPPVAQEPTASTERTASDLPGVQGRRADGGGQGRRGDRRL